MFMVGLGLLIPALGCLYCAYKHDRYERYLQGQLENTRHPMSAQGWRELARALLDMPESRLRSRLAQCLLEKLGPDVKPGAVGWMLLREGQDEDEGQGKEKRLA